MQLTPELQGWVKNGKSNYIIQYISRKIIYIYEYIYTNLTYIYLTNYIIEKQANIDD